jgi:hypothetical protein
LNNGLADYHVVFMFVCDGVAIICRWLGQC